MRGKPRRPPSGPPSSSPAAGSRSGWASWRFERSVSWEPSFPVAWRRPFDWPPRTLAVGNGFPHGAAEPRRLRRRFLDSDSVLKVRGSSSAAGHHCIRLRRERGMMGGYRRRGGNSRLRREGKTRKNQPRSSSRQEIRPFSRGNETASAQVASRFRARRFGRPRNGTVTGLYWTGILDERRFGRPRNGMVTGRVAFAIRFQMRR